MGKTLFIVESKGKLETLRKILGSGYQVEACFGHVRDLKKKGLSIEVDKDFKGDYEITKPDVVQSLRAAAAKADNIMIASDQDLEGWFIAESLCILLKVDPKSNCRILFSEITPVAIKAAIKNPVSLDYNMIHAQYVRRYLDRIVGYGLSPIVMSKIPGAMSAGRVQSAALRWICEKQRERDIFIENGSDSYYKVRGLFKVKKQELKTMLFELVSDKNNGEDKDEDSSFDEDEDELEEGGDSKMKGKRKVAQLSKNVKPSETKEIEKFMNNCKKSTWQIADVRDSESIRHPPPPFMTSSVQVAAAGALGMSSKRTMSCLQVLFEKGYVTYPRTDSIILSKTALTEIAVYVKDNFDKKYYQYREYKDKKESTQGAHECLRCTKYDMPEITDLGRDEQRLYNLVWRRTIASQMSSAKFDVKTIDITSANGKLDNKYLFVSKLETMRFDGYLAVYNFKAPNDEDDVSEAKGIDVKKGLSCDRKTIEAKLEFSSPPGMPTEAALVRSLKTLGIGRPSTYSSIIDKILSRGYCEITDIDGVKMKSRIYTLENEEIVEEAKDVMVGSEKKKLVPSEMGMRVTKFLEDYFPQIVDYKFTAKTEEHMDAVAQGKKDWKKILRKFYDWFEPAVLDIKEKLKAEKLARGDAPQFERIVGKLDDGREIYARNTRTGPAIFVIKEDGKLQYADIPKNIKLEKITEEQARKLLSFPKVLGKRKDIEIILKKGPFGYYLTYGDTEKAPIPKDQDPNELTLDEAIVYLRAARSARQERYIKEFEDDDNTYAVMKGKPKEDKPPSYFIMVKPKKKVKSETDKKSTKKVKKTAEEKEADKKAAEKKKLAAARGKSKGEVIFVSIGDLDPQSITLAIAQKLLKDKLEAGPTKRGMVKKDKKKTDSSSDDGPALQSGGKRQKGSTSRTTKKKVNTKPRSSTMKSTSKRATVTKSKVSIKGEKPVKKSISKIVKTKKTKTKETPSKKATTKKPIKKSITKIVKPKETPPTKKVSTKKATAKKATSKKSTAKKPETTKKSATKKATSKKSTTKKKN
jgi:DNA topoisomerase-1